jgi:DNA-binding transcriptional MerR regulator
VAALDTKAPDAFRTISEVADELDLPQHVLRFWESRFHDIKPMKRGGGRRYYRPDDIDLLRGIRHLLYGEGYTIRGVQRILRDQGSKFVQVVWQEGAPQPPHVAIEDEDYAGETPAGLLEEERGLRRRLSSLIGRDLGDRQDDVEARREPPLQSAPVPRIDPSDRIDHGARPTLPTSEEIDLPNIEAGQERQIPSFGVALPREALNKLQTALQELSECRKLIDAAAARQ